MAKSDKKKEAASERLPAKSVYSVIQSEGEQELGRPAASLFWSGLVAGISISTSVLVEGILHSSLPDADWRGLVEGLGYSVGFLIVILGRQQLFTENTITPVLPIMARFSIESLRSMLKLWAIVLVANLAGTMIAVVFADLGALLSAEQLESMRAVSREAVAGKAAGNVFLSAIPAGFYIAALVWMLPSSKGFEFWVILMVTWIIAIGDFAHVIVGSAEAFLLLVNGELGIVAAFGGYLLPALAGNIIGGTALFSALAYAQVREEI
jgi:formate/nitrite transporter FocA (FNT family)